jgi:hypothetical protein
MTDRAQIRLPGGLWLEGNCHREVILRSLRGRDEELLNESAEALPAERVSGLLACCVERLEGFGELTPGTAAQLTVGDREALLLHLRRLTLGTRLQCLAQCSACGESIDLDLSVDDLLQPPYSDWRPEYETRCPTPDGPLQVRYRLPTGADQRAAALLAAEDLAAAQSFLLRRCVIEVRAGDGSLIEPEEVEAPLLQHLPRELAERDPQAESILDFVCPACGAAGRVLLDAADFLFRELGSRRGELYRQVHRLALHYHWSEAEILSLPWSKRQRYLGLLAEGAEWTAS